MHSGIEFKIDNVLVDTGSAATIFASDYVRKFGIDSESEDKIRKIVGVGGNEYVIMMGFGAVKFSDNLEYTGAPLPILRSFSKRKDDE